MIKTTLQLLAVSTLFVGTTFAQSIQRNCGTMEHLDFLKSQDKTIEAKMNQIEEHTNSFINHQAVMKTSGVINIPVVVHVLYNTAAQNISDAQIKSQIDVLNEDFRRLNADKTNLPTAFAGLAADAEINFCLASKAPNGTATTGIVRKSTTLTSFGSDNKMKSSATGGDDAWNTSQYLNIWVCNLGSGLLGYAQFPGGAASTDGVVILYSAFGRTGTLSAPYNKGRTATHEVGHWLNLRHIWGDASCGSDLVNDTPTQQTSNYGCPTYPHVTCSNGTAGDMFMNYMDYVDDGCMNTFTSGQKTRMQALFAAGGARASLATSPGCGAVTTTTTSTTTATPSTSLTIGSGTGVTTTPYGTYYMDGKVQYIITKAELVAAGYSATKNIIKSLGFNVSSFSSQVMNGFSIKLKHTTSASFASTSFISNTGMTTVYSANTSVASTGWKTHAFTTPFTYNGVDNLLIEICFDNSSYSTDSKAYYTSTSTYKTLYVRSDVATGGVCANTTGTRTYNRPNMRFAMGSTAALLLNDEPNNVLDNSSLLKTIPKQTIADFGLVPNPTKGELTINYFTENENANVEIKLFNIMGELISEFNPLIVEEGANSFNINFNTDENLAHLSNGVYLCTIVIDGKLETKKFVLSK